MPLQLRSRRWDREGVIVVSAAVTFLQRDPQGFEQRTANKNMADSLDEILERAEIESLHKRIAGDDDMDTGRAKTTMSGNRGTHAEENSIYDDEDNQEEASHRELARIFGDDDFDEEEQQDADEEDDGEDRESMINGNVQSTWSSVASAIRLNDDRKRRAFVHADDEAEEAGSDDSDIRDEMSESHDRKRADRLRVVSAAGKDLGALVQNSRLTLEDAYRRVNPIPKPPVIPAPPGSSVARNNLKRKRAENDFDERSSAESNFKADEQLFKECGIAMTDDIRKRLATLSGNAPASNNNNNNDDKTYDPIQTDEEREYTSLEEDLEYTRRHFSDMLRDSNITAELMREVFCPVCGMGGLRGEDSVHAHAYNQVNEMCKAAVQGDKRTHALIISEFWNTSLYRPMRKLNKRILPLTYEMAYHHIKEPHRLEATNDHHNDIRSVDMKKNILDNMIFLLNPLTGNLMYDPKAFSMSMACTRTKNILRKTLPEKMAFYGGSSDKQLSDLLAQNVNPYRNLYMGPTQANSAPGVRYTSAGKKGSTTLGGRRSEKQ